MFREFHVQLILWSEYLYILGDVRSEVLNSPRTYNGMLILERKKLDKLNFRRTISYKYINESYMATSYLIKNI